jgi:hypothetical protein
MTYAQWYETTYPDRRRESTRRDDPVTFHGKAKKPETVEREAREARRDRRSNRCTTCYLQMPVGQETCDCGGNRGESPKKFVPKDGRVAR